VQCVVTGIHDILPMNAQGSLTLNCEQSINFLLSVSTFLSLGSDRMIQNQNNNQVFGNIRAHFHQKNCAQHLCQDKWCRCCFLTCKVQFLRTGCIISKLWMVSSIQKYKRLLHGKAGHCYKPTQVVRKWPGAHVWKLIGALQKNM